MNKVYLIVIIIFVLIGIIICCAFLPPSQDSTNISAEDLLSEQNSFFYSFDDDYILEESGTIEESSDENWSVSSGAWLNVKNGYGQTTQGNLPISDKWHQYYAEINPLDTDDGMRPQNIFRLIQRGSWKNFEQEAYFRIVKNNINVSPNCRQSNGLFLFNRYYDSDNLYCTGIRVDGRAAIKKKSKGTYYALAHELFFTGEPYDKTSNPTLLPQNVWIGLKSIVKNNIDDTVIIQLFVDVGRTGEWVLAAEARDDGEQYGGEALLSEGYAGIRTDFMDVEFDDYLITEYNVY